LQVRVIRNQREAGLRHRKALGCRDGIDRFLIACTCVGLDVATGALYAPNGLGELARGLLRANPLISRPGLFRQKAGSYRSRWPWLTILP
jgi:uncharacterized protein